jgi:chromosome partitioning protein
MEIKSQVHMYLSCGIITFLKNMAQIIGDQLESEQKEYKRLKSIKLKKPKKTVALAFTNQKGGVGKTTSAVNLADAFAQKNLKTLLIDIDQQGNASTALNVPHSIGDKTIYDILTKKNVNFNEYTYKCSDNLFCIPASTNLSMLELTLRDELLLTNTLSKYLQSDSFDYIIIDCPPSMGIFTLNAIIFAKQVFIPIQCEYYALEGLTQLMTNISEIKTKFNTNVTVASILMTMFDSRNNLSKDVVKEVKTHFPLLVLDTLIPRSVRIAEAPSFNETIFKYDKKSVGALSYMQVAIELNKKTAI